MLDANMPWFVVLHVCLVGGTPAVVRLLVCLLSLLHCLRRVSIKLPAIQSSTALEVSGAESLENALYPFYPDLFIDFRASTSFELVDVSVILFAA